MHIVLENIEKKFNDELLFQKVNYTFQTPTKVALLGINGSGKSTLLQIISGFLSPSKGKVTFIENDIKIEEEEMYGYVAICAPYLELIEEMNLVEFFEYHFGFKQKMMPIEKMIEYIGLEKSKHKLIEKFSSGMKQRVKLAHAFMSETPILLLHEPCTNLDEEGYNLYYKMIKDFTENRIVMVASNDEKETHFFFFFYFIKDFK